MKNRKQCIQDTEDQTHEGMEGKVCVCENTELYYSGSSCEGLIFFICSLNYYAACFERNYVNITALS